METKPTYEELEQRVLELEGTELHRNITEMVAFPGLEKHDAIILLIEPDSGNIINANIAAQNYYGYSIKTLKQMNIQEINMLSRDEVAEKRQQATTEKLNYFEFPHRLSSGEIRKVEVHSSPIFLNDKKLLLSIINDITERKQTEEALRESEKKYRTLIGSLQEGLWIIDKDAYTSFVNSRMAELLGYTQDEMLGMHLFEFLDEKGIEGAKINLKRRKNGVKEQHDSVFLRKDGRKIYTLIETTPLFDDEEHYLGALASVMDISERKQAEAELKQAHDKLEQRVKERTNELEIQKKSLEDVNTALNVMLKKRDEDKLILEERVLFNVKELIEPLIENLKKSGLDENQTDYVNTLDTFLAEIVSPFSQTLHTKFLNLTLSEIRVANLIKEGKTTKEIAGLLDSTPRAITFHRQNLRKKLGLGNRKANLGSYLLSLLK